MLRITFNIGYCLIVKIVPVKGFIQENPENIH